MDGHYKSRYQFASYETSIICKDKIILYSKKNTRSCKIHVSILNFKVINILKTIQLTFHLTPNGICQCSLFNHGGGLF